MDRGEHITGKRLESRHLGAKSCWEAGVFTKWKGSFFPLGFSLSLDSLLAIEFYALDFFFFFFLPGLEPFGWIPKRL